MCVLDEWQEPSSCLVRWCAPQVNFLTRLGVANARFLFATFLHMLAFVPSAFAYTLRTAPTAALRPASRPFSATAALRMSSTATSPVAGDVVTVPYKCNRAVMSARGGLLEPARETPLHARVSYRSAPARLPPQLCFRPVPREPALSLRARLRESARQPDAAVWRPVEPASGSGRRAGARARTRGQCRGCS